MIEWIGRSLDAAGICLRWQMYAGKEAVLDGDGRTFDEVARERSAVSA